MTVPAAGTAAGLAAALRVPVWNALADRADALRRSLPPRPEAAGDRFAWWRTLTPTQARDATALEHLDALCEHIKGSGRPAPGYAPDDPLPEAALEAADGFTSADVAARIADYRALRDALLTQRPPGRPAAAP